jgi:hypothetical protein
MKTVREGCHIIPDEDREGMCNHSLMMETEGMLRHHSLLMETLREGHHIIPDGDREGMMCHHSLMMEMERMM